MTCTPATLAMMRSAATSALGLPTSFSLRETVISACVYGQRSGSGNSYIPEEELSVEIGDVDRVHINHVYVAKATQG